MARRLGRRKRSPNAVLKCYDSSHVRFLFIAAAFLSSTLLFMIEPIAAKIILPTFGGAPAVWNTSLLFFQSVLLLGYGYAHWGAVKMNVRPHAVLHLVVAAVALLALPISSHGVWFHTVRSWAAADRPPIPLIFLALGGLIGLPFFALSANSSTLQKWYALTRQPDAHQPWFLYSAGNVGSMLALLSYPSLIEPRLTLGEQGRIWTFGYVGLIVLLVACGWIGARAQSSPAENSEEELKLSEPIAAVTARDRWRWLALAAVPSSLLLGVTTYLTSNIAPIPLLWVVPLSLYLLTFILVFARRPLTPARQLGRIYPLILTPLIVVLVLEATSPLLALFHLAVFFVAAWMCHSLLAISKPGASHLTEFFFYVSLGGVIGGIFNAIIAPLVFNTLAEYPAALVFAALLMPRREGLKSKPLMDAIYPAAVAGVMILIVLGAKVAGLQASTFRTFLTIGIPAILCFLAVDSPTRFGLTVAAGLLVASGLHIASDGTVVLTERSFFGVHRIVEKNHGELHELINGNTIHGIENFALPKLTPLTYYYPNGPIGQVMTGFQPRTAAFVGLGVGSLAAYGQPGDRFTYYEIDPIVVNIASNPHWFTFLRDSKARVGIRLGDARLELDNTRATYQLIVLDAFSSDAIPVHLLTLEAIQMYLRHLEPGGLLAFHISNRYLELEPILSAATRDLGLIGYLQVDGPSEEETAIGKTQSQWVIIGRRRADFRGFKVSWWNDLAPTPNRAWTDDYSNVLGAFKKPGDY
jgi:hypothetical protein